MAWMRSGVRSPSAPLETKVPRAARGALPVFSVAFASFGPLACNEPKVSPPAEERRGVTSSAATVAPPPSVPDPSGSTSAESSGPAAPTAAGACKTDADCRTWSSYCKESPCSCRVIGKTEADPSCASPGHVACVVDPCMRKAAACQSGRCQLVMAESK